MIKKIILLSLLTISIYANDSDMDGVLDEIDRCPNTPFFDEVDAFGCTSNRLVLPQDSLDSLYIILGYGLNHNEDLTEEKESKYNSSLEINYYKNSWNYSLIFGYLYDNDNSSLEDTIFKIKYSFEFIKDFKLSFGVGFKFPNYDFDGNEMDYQIQSSFIYYYNKNSSIFGGISYEFINDTSSEDIIDDIKSFYLGIGYFWSDNLYSNLSYSYKDSKFQSQDDISLIQTTLFYKINDNYFTTISYGQQIFDNDLHNSFNINIGYTFW